MKKYEFSRYIKVRLYLEAQKNIHVELKREKVMFEIREKFNREITDDDINKSKSKIKKDFIITVLYFTRYYDIFNF
uniref:Uncharacterized protein n=1 Tax=viral metagenome TaxID=1070528 RepID=A0A6C0AFP7_9ZZZZ